MIEGSLIIDDKPGLTLDAHYIFVHGGLLQIGTEEEPYQNDILITLHGDRNTPTLPTYGNKFIAVRGGVLDIHGVPRTPVWTFINETIYPGDTSLIMSEEVDWKGGETIVVASTSFDHAQSEEKIISHKSGNVVTVTTPFKYKHYGVIEDYDGTPFDMRAEVGLLSRNIKIRGTDEGKMYGAHIMLASPNDESSIGRIEYLEIFNAGQAFMLGRYPIHFHMIGKITKSYVRGNSIHHTFNRAITTHGVHYQRLLNNVAYLNMGMTYFIEDGIESMNIIDHNLGISSVRSWSLLNKDQTPSTFWITNPNNIVTNNHAAGSDNFGFWIDLSKHPDGPSSTNLVCPLSTPLGIFADNTAHSNGQYGFRIWNEHKPVIDSCGSWKTSQAVTATYERFTGWKNNHDSAIAEEIGDVRFVDFKVADNHKAGIEVTYTEFSTPYTTARLSGALIVGKSNNTEDDVSGSIGVITPQTDGWLVENVKFYNFDDDMYPIGDESHSKFPVVRDFGGRLHKLKGLTFVNSHKRIHWEIPYRGIYEILDDSYTGKIGSFVAAPWDHLLTPECTLQNDLYNAIVCDGAKIRRVLFYGLSPGIFSGHNLNIQRTTGDNIPTTSSEIVAMDGTISTQTEPKWTKLSEIIGCQKKFPIKSWAVPIVTGYNYDVFWGRGNPLD